VAGQRTKPWWLPVLMFFLYLAVLEGGVRLIFGDTLRQAEEPPAQSSENASNLTGSPYLLWELEPGIRTMDGVPAKINRLGMRGADLAVPKPEGVRRVLVTGDSSNFGFRVPDEAVLVSVAVEALGGARAGIEGINASVPGYSTYQTINFLEMRAWDLEPDVVVIGNLSSDNNFDAFVDKELLASYSRFEDGWIGSLHDSLKISAVYRILDHKTRVTKGVDAAKKVGWGLGTGSQIGKRRVEVNDFARNLDHMVRETRAHGAEAVFLLPAVSRDMDPDVTEPAAWELYRQVMREAALRLGVPILELPDLFKSSGYDAGELFLDEMHPTALGHRIIGEALARTLTQWEKGQSSERSGLRKPGNGKPLTDYADRFLFVEGSDQTPTDVPDPAGAVQSAEWHKVKGEIRMSGYEGKILQVDARNLDDLERPVVDSEKLEEPGPFLLSIPVDITRVGLVVYVDREGDGPSARDRRFDFMEDVLSVVGAVDGVQIDLDKGEIQLPE
jgi:lysophospholipase L1-like esterase